MFNFDQYNVLLAIATNIPQRLKTQVLCSRDTYISSNSLLMYSLTPLEFGYKVDIVTWNQKKHWGYLTIKLSNGQEEAQVELNQ